MLVYLYNNHGGKNMSLSYEPLWQMLNNLNISKMEFAKMIGMSNATLAKLSKNEPITLTTVDKICNQFNCPIEYIVKHIQDRHDGTSTFTIGSIIIANDLSNINTNDFRLRKRLYVILKDTMRDDSGKILYKVAPIFKSATISSKDSSNIYFKDVNIDGKPTTGYISLKNTLESSTGKIERKVGLMPQEYMQKISYSPK